MLIDRAILEDELLLLFEEFNTDKEVRNYVIDRLGQKGIFKTDVSAMFDKLIELKGLDKSVLYLLSKAFYEKLDRGIINPEKYFTKTEIQKFKTYDFTLEQEEIFPIVLKNVLKLNDDHYTTVLDIQTIGKWFSNRIIKYNPKTQRPRIQKQIRDKIIEMNDINPKRVEKIAQRIEKGLQFNNYITINILEDGKEYLEYNENEKKLTIYKGELNITDGGHRSMAFLHVLAKNPNIKFNTGLMITHFSEQKAINFIYQEELKEPMSERFRESINPDRLVNKIVNKLNETGDLRGLITTEIDVIRNNKAITLTDTLADSIEYHYEIKSQKDVYDISKWLIEFFGFLVGYNPEAFKPELDLEKFKEIKKESYISYKDMFIGYIALSKVFYNKENWVDELYETLDNIDFSKNNRDWEELSLTQDTLNKSYIKRISNYFIEKVV